MQDDQPDANGPPNLFSRLRAQFTRIKLPAWLVLLLLAVREIPDWKGRIDFWIEAAHHMGGDHGRHTK